MSKLVVLSLGNGNLNDGFATVTAQVWATDDSRLKMQMQVTGSLPAAPNIEKLYGNWQLLYKALSETLRNRSELEIEEGDITNVSEEEFEEICRDLGKEINTWLNSDSFRNIDQKLRAELAKSDEIRLLIETNDILVQRLPWHLWKFFEDYPQAEVGLSAPEWRVKPQRRNPTKQVRILAILGDSTGIDVEKDQEMLNGLPNAKVIFPEKKRQREQLNEQLWGGGWDILFFAGHSKTEGETGKIYINETESLTVDKLRFALQQAIAGGLRLAIFNSCDGLGLARDFANLHLGQMIVMREPVPDQVAHEFLKYFLAEFAGGKSLYMAVRSAREKLQGLEGDFRCASWMPVIFQNPSEVPPTWEELSCGRRGERGSRSKWVKLGAASLAATSLVLGARQLGRLTSRTGAGSRGGNCDKPKKPLTALVTEEKIGLTVSERPTFWFYMPYPSTARLSAEFVLRDEQKKDVYQTTLPVPGTGIVSVPLPETVSPLESGKTYRWVFAVICDSGDRMKDDFVEGEVTREALQPDVRSQLEAATTDRDRLIIYAENSLWYEAVTLLAELRRRSPEDKTLADDWADLLGDVKLADLATEPFVP